MVYLITKDVCPGPDEVIIITSSLMKDMNSSTDLYRANAIRVLCAITDPALLGQIERYLKQAVVDKAPAVASAVLVAGAHLLAANPDTSVVRRWAGEVGEAAAGRHPMVQFHAVGLAHALRRGDRLAVSKLVAQLVRSGVRSPWPSACWSGSSPGSSPRRGRPWAGRPPASPAPSTTSWSPASATRRRW